MTAGGGGTGTAGGAGTGAVGNGTAGPASTGAVHGLDHLAGVDPHEVEDDGELVHEGDVDVPLAVLDHLRGLGDLDGGRAVNAGVDDQQVRPRPARQRR